MSTGLISLLTSLLGYLPAPIFVGAVVDSTCRLWQTTTCGDHKSCLLYDTDQFRWKFLLTAACMKIAGAVLDCIVSRAVHWGNKPDGFQSCFASEARFPHQITTHPKKRLMRRWIAKAEAGYAFVARLEFAAGILEVSPVN